MPVTCHGGCGGSGVHQPQAPANNRARGDSQRVAAPRRTMAKIVAILHSLSACSCYFTTSPRRLTTCVFPSTIYRISSRYSVLSTTCAGGVRGAAVACMCCKRRLDCATPARVLVAAARLCGEKNHRIWGEWYWSHCVVGTEEMNVHQEQQR